MNQSNSTIELFSTFQPELRLPFPGSYSQWLHTFPDIFIELLANNTTNFSRFHNIINNNDNFIELLVNNATDFFRVYIKQDWYFQRVPSKLNHEKNFFESSYHTILTLSESYSKQYWLIQSSYQTAQTIVNTFLRVSMDTYLKRTKNSQVKMRIVSIQTWNR